ncbi:MAG: DUF885 domain-containing protein [Chloroflexi bacterium]|nr:DUF885 domain-containing protein [Chloroflexota bacterium]
MISRAGFVLGGTLSAVLTLAVSAEPVDTQAWDRFVDRFIEEYFVIHPVSAVKAGRHEFDGKLPDWSPRAFGKEIKWLLDQRTRALAFNPESLGERRRFEHSYMLNVIDKLLFRLGEVESPYRNPMFYSGALSPDVYVSREYAPVEARLRAYVAYASAVPRAAAQIRSNLKPPLPRTYIDVGKTVFGGLALYYEKDAAAAFAAVKDPELQTEFKVANEQATKAMQGLVAWLEGERARATDDFALGRRLFLKMLWDKERVDMPLERLERAGREELERNLSALREACDQYARGETVATCVAKVQAAKPRGNPVTVAAQQLEGLKAFIVEKALVTIPGEQQAQVAEAPPYRRWNLASIDIPGPYEKPLPGTYYIAPPDPAWSEAERQAYVPSEAYLLFITAHEVWPGHFLQHLHAHRAGSKFGQLFNGYAFAEGWAHYAEEMIWEAGLNGGDAKTRIGQLLGALKRNVRYLSAIGLHTRGMSLEESERMFRELAYQDPGNARQQAARGTFDPAYLSYTLGKLMIRKLREEWTASRGGRKAWGAFHDKLLSFGGPPIPLIREAMLGSDAGPPL